MKDKMSSIGGMVTALLASACCIGPALFLALGLTGLGFLSAFEWLRPYLIVATFVFVGLSYHYAYGRGSTKCGPGGTCIPAARRINRVLFWALIGFAAFGISFPYLAAGLLA